MDIKPAPFITTHRNDTIGSNYPALMCRRIDTGLSENKVFSDKRNPSLTVVPVNHRLHVGPY